MVATIGLARLWNAKHEDAFGGPIVSMVVPFLVLPNLY